MRSLVPFNKTSLALEYQDVLHCPLPLGQSGDSTCLLLPIVSQLAIFLIFALYHGGFVGARIDITRSPRVLRVQE